jgi:hypothetical protein
MSGHRIRKPVNELTPDDLERFPVWEYALDEEGDEGQDETTVRPVESDGLLDPDDGSFIVRAVLNLADGTRYTGYLNTPFQGETDLGTIQPVVVTPAGQIGFWWGMIEPTATDIAESYQRLGKSSSTQIFPLRYQSDVDIVDGPVAGEIAGFVILEDFTTMRTRVVT